MAGQLGGRDDFVGRNRGTIFRLWKPEQGVFGKTRLPARRLTLQKNKVRASSEIKPLKMNVVSFDTPLDQHLPDPGNHHPGAVEVAVPSQK